MTLRAAGLAGIAAMVLALFLAACAGKAGRETSPGKGALETTAVAATMAKPPVPGFPAPFGWRGDDSGRFPDADPPLEWSDETNVLWKTEVGVCHSSPVVAGGRVFLTAEEEGLLCLNADNGEILWTRENGFDQLPPEVRDKAEKHSSACGYASPTPVTDGLHVWVAFGSGVVTCFDIEGKRRWIRQFQLEPATADGRSASPVLADGRLIVSITHLIALDAATGETLWEQPDSEEKYGTPATSKVGDVAVLITPGGEVIRLSDGRILAKGMGGAEYSSPVAHNGMVYFLDPETVAWQLPEAAADEIDPEEVWMEPTEGEFFSSPVLHDGVLYGVSNEGFLCALDAAEGGIIFRQKLPICSAVTESTSNILASIVLVGGHLLVGNEAGEMLILGPAKEYKEIRRNRLPKGSGATPAVCGGRLYVRSGAFLFCVGK